MDAAKDLASKVVNVVTCGAKGGGLGMDKYPSRDVGGPSPITNITEGPIDPEVHGGHAHTADTGALGAHALPDPSQQAVGGATGLTGATGAHVARADEPLHGHHGHHHDKTVFSDNGKPLMDVTERGAEPDTRATDIGSRGGDPTLPTPTNAGLAPLSHTHTRADATHDRTGTHMGVGLGSAAAGAGLGGVLGAVTGHGREHHRSGHATAAHEGAHAYEGAPGAAAGGGIMSHALPDMGPTVDQTGGVGSTGTAAKVGAGTRGEGFTTATNAHEDRHTGGAAFHLAPGAAESMSDRISGSPHTTAPHAAAHTHSATHAVTHPIATLRETVAGTGPTHGTGAETAGVASGRETEGVHTGHVGHTGHTGLVGGLTAAVKEALTINPPPGPHNVDA